MYAFKKFIGALAGPLIASLLLLGMAAALRAFGRRRASLWVVATAGVIAYLGSAPWFGALLMGGLERQHPSAVTAALPAVEYIVVLGSGYSPSDGIPITGALDADGLARIVEGIRLSKAMSSARLIVSGGAPEGQGRAAHGYAQLARELGVPQSSLVVLDTPLDTAAEARAIAEMLRTTPFVLVTSAYHMPRAMRLMTLAGAQPVPAPTGQRIRRGSGWNWRSLLPSSAGLRMTEQALHEYLGLILVAVSS
jgi:uncharacterized SAM-binding protein YcdF (DUF218 family)